MDQFNCGDLKILLWSSLKEIREAIYSKSLMTEKYSQKCQRWLARILSHQEFLKKSYRRFEIKFGDLRWITNFLVKDGFENLENKKKNLIHELSKQSSFLRTIWIRKETVYQSREQALKQNFWGPNMKYRHARLPSGNYARYRNYKYYNIHVTVNTHPRALSTVNAYDLLHVLYLFNFFFLK